MCVCGRGGRGGGAQSQCRCGSGGRSPGADVADVSPVPVQMWQRWAQSRRRWGTPSPVSQASGAPAARLADCHSTAGEAGCTTSYLPALGRVRPCRQGRAASLGRRTGQRRNGQPIAARRHAGPTAPWRTLHVVLHAARCPLHAACCTLHDARCTLHAARCALRAVCAPDNHRDRDAAVWQPFPRVDPAQRQLLLARRPIGSVSARAVPAQMWPAPRIDKKARRGE